MACPRRPAAWMLLATSIRPAGSYERVGRRYGRRVAVPFPYRPPAILLSDPDDVRELFLASPELIHPGEGAQVLQPFLGSHSVILLDERPHLEQRRLLLPAFHGERMQRMAEVMVELAEREVESWPLGEPVALRPRLQRLALELILRVVFGLERGQRLDRLRDELTRLLAWAGQPLSYLVPVGSRRLGRLPQIRRLNRLRASTDAMIYALIEERRGELERGEAAGDDVLSALLAARHEDEDAPGGAGSPMSAQEIRDELVTALVAGHETTASQLAWALAVLARAPAVTARLVGEIDAGEGDEYLTATVHEILRIRPVLPNAEPRLTKAPVTIGGVHYPPGVLLVACIYLLHRDPAIYPEPHAFRPERFLGRQPGTYTWIPFGGGRRRCIGASFAMLEMKVVLRAALERYALEPPTRRLERSARRFITFSPSRGGEVILRPRVPAARPQRETLALVD